MSTCENNFMYLMRTLTYLDEDAELGARVEAANIQGRVCLRVSQFRRLAERL